MDDEIDFALKILNRAKNCNKVYMKLLMLKENSQFDKKNRDNDLYRIDMDKWFEYVHGNICECIDLIEGK